MELGVKRHIKILFLNYSVSGAVMSKMGVVTCV